MAFISPYPTAARRQYDRPLGETETVSAGNVEVLAVVAFQNVPLVVIGNDLKVAYPREGELVQARDPSPNLLILDESQADILEGLVRTGLLEEVR
jgi:hypothetical protein